MRDIFNNRKQKPFLQDKITLYWLVSKIELSPIRQKSNEIAVNYFTYMVTAMFVNWQYRNIHRLIIDISEPRVHLN